MIDRKTDNWLITGSNGFIGSNFVAMLARAAFHSGVSMNGGSFILNPRKIICFDAMTYAAMPDHKLREFIGFSKCGNIKTIPGDIRERGLVKYLIDLYDIDIVVNFAAETHVDNSITRPGSFVESNVNGVYQLLEAIRETKKKPRFHHISTDEVFGSLDEEDKPWTEESPYSPNSPYAATKAAADHLVRSFGKAYEIEFSITHSCNCFGRNQFPEKLIPRLVKTSIEEGKIYVYGNGRQLREWKYVEDNCLDILYAIILGEKNTSYCIGGGIEKRVSDVVDLSIKKMLDRGIINSAPEIVNIPDPRGLSQDHRYSMNDIKFRSIPRVSKIKYTEKDFDFDLGIAIESTFHDTLI